MGHSGSQQCGCSKYSICLRQDIHLSKISFEEILTSEKLDSLNICLFFTSDNQINKFIDSSLQLHNTFCVIFQLKELYTLLNENYVEDDDNMFRFDYSPNFLKW